MKVRDLERLLVEHGVGAAKIDAVTRRLRHNGRLPKGGRGPNAPDIGPIEAATILLALAGSSTGAEADIRLEKLETLPLRRSSAGAAFTLLQALTDALDRPESITGLKEVRVGRTTRHALFVYADGRLDEFRRESSRKSDRFYVESVVPAQLLSKVASEVARGVPDEHGAERPS